MGQKLPTLSLAPMQDVSTLPLWQVMHRRGGPDIYVTEYFRVHPDSHPSREILRSITDSHTGKPVIAQMIGNNPAELARTAIEIQDQADCAGIDMNLGCPAPQVCGKRAGGALLRDLPLIREIAETLRPVVQGKLTMKTRVGFENENEFDELLELFANLPIDGLAIHGRTVRERYRSDVHTEEIKRAVESLPYPVTANGSMVCVQSALSMKEKTGASGLMIGRGAIRNPWIFRQIRASLEGHSPFLPTLIDLKVYITELYETVADTAQKYNDRGHVQRMKKFMNYIASGISGGEFTHDIRRVSTPEEFWQVCDRHLDSGEIMEAKPESDGKVFCGFETLVQSNSQKCFAK